VLVGFAAEDGADVERAEAKRQRKGVDLIVLNDISRSDIGFDVDDNDGRARERRGARSTLPRAGKAGHRGCRARSACSNSCPTRAGQIGSPVVRWERWKQHSPNRRGLETRGAMPALRVIANVRRAVSGEPAVVERARVVALLAEGHVLVEGRGPASAKTTLARARLARLARLCVRPHPVQPRTCCRAMSPGVKRVSTSARASSRFPARAGLRETSCSADELKPRVPRARSRRCSRACRSAR